MTQQWQLSGNAENVDWSDLAMAGRAYADNLVGEPAISKVMHMMADEIERLRAAVRPQPYAKNDENRVLYDTKSPRSGALSGCETVPDPDSRVWDTPCTPQPHATPQQGSAQGAFWDSRNAKQPVAWAVAGDYGEYAVKLCFDEASAVLEADRRCMVGLRPDYVAVPLYRQPQPTLTDEDRAEVGRARDGLLSGIDGYENEFANEKRRRAGVLDGILKRFV